jgi:hypothetical protein
MSPFKSDTGFLPIAAGSYYVTITATGAKTPAIGPLAVTLADKRIPFHFDQHLVALFLPWREPQIAIEF